MHSNFLISVYPTNTQPLLPLVSWSIAILYSNMAGTVAKWAALLPPNKKVAAE